MLRRISPNEELSTVDIAKTIHKPYSAIIRITELLFYRLKIDKESRKVRYIGPGYGYIAYTLTPVEYMSILIITNRDLLWRIIEELRYSPMREIRTLIGNVYKEKMNIKDVHNVMSLWNTHIGAMDPITFCGKLDQFMCEITEGVK